MLYDDICNFWYLLSKSTKISRESASRLYKTLNRFPIAHADRNQRLHNQFITMLLLLLQMQTHRPHNFIYIHYILKKTASNPGLKAY